MSFALGSVVQALAFEALTVQRRTVAYSAGVASPSVPDTMTVPASVTMSSGKEIQRLPEGRRALAAITIYSTAELLVDDVAAGVLADVVTWRGIEYEAVRVEDWSDFGYWLVIATRRSV